MLGSSINNLGYVLLKYGYKFSFKKAHKAEIYKHNYSIIFVGKLFMNLFISITTRKFTKHVLHIGPLFYRIKLSNYQDHWCIVCDQ